MDSKRNRSVEGTGLGLAIVRHLVELMGGLIDVNSVYGKGTVVTITIPQKIVDRRSTAEVPEIPKAELERAEAFTAPDVKVLVVDDNLINRKVARGFLKSYAFDLTEAESGAEAIELVRKNRYDIIFMDHMMPMMDGIEAAEIIRRDCGENGAAPAIIALTANAMEGMRQRRPTAPWTRKSFPLRGSTWRPPPAIAPAMRPASPICWSCIIWTASASPSSCMSWPVPTSTATAWRYTA